MCDLYPLIIIAGPTGVGKTDISIKLAKLINGEIISADSIQVYKGLDIGSAKITASEMQGVTHYLIDALEPTDNFGVDVFVQMSKAAINEIVSRGHIPIIVGGTGFYIQALLYGIDFTQEEEHDDSYRNELSLLAGTEEGKNTLFDKLCELDYEYAMTTHKNNVKRVIRALEYIHFTGKKFSQYNDEGHNKDAQYNFAYFALTMNREKMYERIDKRVDKMIADGLITEVKNLMQNGLDDTCQSMQGIGYRETVAFLNGETDLDEAIELIKKNTRHFAKRQLTWLRREKEVVFIDKDVYSSDEKMLNYMKETIYDKGII